MADDPMKRGGRDRSRVAGDQEHEVRHFAEQNGLTVEEARALFEQVGNDRKKFGDAVEQMKARRGP
ncbi:DUF3606 domain-containing protein [Rhodoligotrophos defluvii]|uniref:DUF3606 domain-containing protein n=1 Tax=Rhodoligotrophos defluvii TaxID=2561934 RepID=UPI0010C9A82C|nr:DUF3606 domain-containing protein [Rhodoligotrophos defluvii]